MSLFIWPLFESESDPLGHWAHFWQHLTSTFASLWDDPVAVLVTFQTAVTSSLHVFCSHSHQVIGNLSREVGTAAVIASSVVQASSVLNFPQLLDGNLTSAYHVLEEESQSLFEYLGLTDFQWKLIREFSLILLGNLLLVFLAWKVTRSTKRV